MLAAFVFLNGCSVEERYTNLSEGNIQPYIPKALDMGETPNFDYVPSIEDLFMNAFKAKVFNNSIEDLKLAMSDEGLLADEKCTIYLPIGQLASICDGKTRLYIDDKLIYEFDSEEKIGKSYLLIQEALAKRIGDYIVNPTWFPD